MNKISLSLLSYLYTLLALLAATFMSPLGPSMLALALLLVLLVDTLRPWPPNLNIAIILTVIFLMPTLMAPLLDRLTLGSLAALPMISILFSLPIIYLLDHSLRQNARRQPGFMKKRTGRHTTPAFNSLFLSALVIMLISPVVANPALLFTGIAFILYLLGVLMGILLTIPGRPLTTPTIRKRIIAGTTGGVALNITVIASVKLHLRFHPADPWVKVTPSGCSLDRGQTKLNLSFTPPLAGQSRPRLEVSAIDPWGFIQIDQLLEPALLHVIPRAKYAAWLARKYLEQTGSGIAATAPPPGALMPPKRGIEYLDSRTYQPGDQLKDIDWKHTLKLSQLIVKEYTETGEQAAIIAVNLSVTGAEAADKLAFNLITVALTLARENIPSALAAYNHRSVILSTPVSEPEAILRQALALVIEISPVELADRRLEPSDIAKIRRNIGRLKLAESEPARRLLNVLNFEYRAIEEAARNHPATITLAATTRQAPAPATIFLVSQLNHDAEAILVTAEKLSRRKFTTIPIDASL